MSTRGASIVPVLVAVAAVGAASATLRARDTAYPLEQASDRLLYLRSGRVADRLMLSFDALAADVYWIRAIQHYGRDAKSLRTTDRFELLQPLLDLTTTLDPHFNIAYRFGAIFLAKERPDGPGRSDQAIALLEKGLRANPQRWQYAFDIGFIHYWSTHDFAAAAASFERASAMSGAPIWLRSLAAMTRVQGGDRQGARALLGELVGSEEKYIRQAAQRGLQQLDALDLIDRLQAAVETYQTQNHAYPASWADMQRAGLPGLPPDPTGELFVYDGPSHTVTLSPTSSLAPLPQLLRVR